MQEGKIKSELHGRGYITTVDEVDRYIIANRGKPICLAISNLKGGVGKTTIAKNVAVALAKKFRVLVIDADTQGNTSYGLGVHHRENTIGRVLLEQCSVHDAIVSYSNNSNINLDVIPASFEDYIADIELANHENGTNILKQKIKGVYDDYDIIIIDCSPSLTLLSINALTLADYIFIPVILETYSIYGLKQYLPIINDTVKEYYNPDLIISGIIVSRYDKRRKLSNSALDILESDYKDLLVPTYVRENVAISEADLQGKSVIEYKPNSNGAIDFRSLAKDILNCVRD
jgi:chromosome partitioning protein